MPFAGKKVSIQTQWTGGEGEGFAAAIKDFQTATGITVQVDSIGSSHETVLKTRIEGGSPPDMAALAQPTGVLAYAAEGKVIDVATFMDQAREAQGRVPVDHRPHERRRPHLEHPDQGRRQVDDLVPGQGLRGQGLHGSQDLGRARGPGRQDRRRRQPPVLRQRRRPRHGDGLGADGLGRGGPPQDRGSAGHQRLDQRTRSRSSDPKIKAAFDKVGSLLFKDGYVDGGGQAIVNNDLKTVMDPMFNEDTAAPGCWMQKIPVWYGPDFFPDRRTSGGDSKYTIGDDGDIGIFPFPTICDTFKGAEGSADSFMVLNDRPEVRALAEFLATPEGLEGWIKSVGVLSPNVKVPAEWYADNYKLKVANDIASGATADRLRRLRPDAPGRRPGQLLDRHLRLGQRKRHEHRFRAEGHRRQLAQVTGTSSRS